MLNHTTDRDNNQPCQVPLWQGSLRLARVFHRRSRRGCLLRDAPAVVCSASVQSRVHYCWPRIGTARSVALPRGPSSHSWQHSSVKAVVAPFWNCSETPLFPTRRHHNIRPFPEREGGGLLICFWGAMHCPCSSNSHFPHFSPSDETESKTFSVPNQTAHEFFCLWWSQMILCIPHLP